MAPEVIKTIADNNTTKLIAMMAERSMADSIEAASRSMKEVNQKIIEELVENIIGYQQSENQFDLSDLTLKEITTIKELFMKRLQTIYHTRIEYPK